MGSHGRLLGGVVLSAATPMREGAGQAKTGGRLMTDEVTGTQRGERLAQGQSRWYPQGATLNWEGR